MRHLLQSLIISIAVIAIASPSFASDDREGKKWDRDKKEQRHHGKKEKHHGNPFDMIMEQLDDLNDKLDELLANGVDLRGVTQNWDKELDSTNGDANGCNSDRFTCIWPTDEHPDGAAVRDNETGLVWERSPDTTIFEWPATFTHCASRAVGGHKGFHLPTIEQLSSLFPLVADDLNSASGDGPFSNVLSGAYWSATSLARESFRPFTRAYYVRFSDGLVFNLNKDENGGQLHVWCVRGGQAYDGQNLQLIIDQLTAP